MRSTEGETSAPEAGRSLSDKMYHNREGCKEYTSVKKRQTSNHLKKGYENRASRKD